MISFSLLMAPQDLHSSSTFLFSWTMFSLGNLTTQVHEEGGELVVVWEGQECGVLAMMEPTTSFSHAVPFWRLTIMISPWCETVNDPPFRGPRCGRL